jgi:ketosteroid isomerase-like protein
MCFVGDRERLIRQAFAALAEGDLEPLQALLAPEAEWVGIPNGRVREAARCEDRGSIVDVLRRHHANGRRFSLEEAIEERDRIAVGINVSNPSWSASVRLFRVFTFRPDEDVVVRINDCLDESYALQVLVA